MLELPNWAYEVKHRYPTRIKNAELIIKTCPDCGNERWNVQINIRTCLYHCWACDAGGSVKKFLLAQDIRFDPLDIQPQREKKITSSGAIKLPTNTPLIGARDPMITLAVRYLRGRGMTIEDIISLDLRLAVDKDWHGHILAPFYGMTGLEYFLGIRFWPKKGYKLPPADKVTKDKFVPIRRLQTTLVIVEGFFDMYAVYKYTKHAILLMFGKFIMDEQLRALQAANYETVTVCLDADAEKDAAKLAARLFRAGIRTYLAMLPPGKDPDDMKERIGEIIENAEEVTQTTRSKRLRKSLKERIL